MHTWRRSPEEYSEDKPLKFLGRRATTMEAWGHQKGRRGACACVDWQNPSHSMCPGLMSVDSQAAFRAEAIRLGVSEAHADLLINKGIRNHSLFAFISSYQPGASDEKPFVDALVAKLGEEAKESLPAFRHLFYTSHTLAVQELKDKLEPREEAKRLSMADRVGKTAEIADWDHHRYLVGAVARSGGQGCWLCRGAVSGPARVVKMYIEGGRDAVRKA